MRPRPMSGTRRQVRAVFLAHRAALQGGFKVGDVVGGHGDQGAAGVEVRGAQGVLIASSRDIECSGWPWHVAGCPFTQRPRHKGRGSRVSIAQYRQAAVFGCDDRGSWWRNGSATADHCSVPDPEAGVDVADVVLTDPCNRTGLFRSCRAEGALAQHRRLDHPPL
jgi:hypothetical protein